MPDSNPSALPAFLERVSDTAYTLTLSPSLAETAMLCGAKVSWRYLTGIEAAAPRAGLNYGKCLHSLLEAHYGGREFDPEALVRDHFAANPQPELGSRGRPEWRTAARALQAYRAYLAAYPAEDFEVLGVEEKFDIALGEFMPNSDRDTTRVTVRIHGIRDLRVRWHDQLWVLDHKTSRDWSDLTVDEGKASFQFMAYAWVERLLAGQVPVADRLPVGGVIGNYLISREPYSNPDRKPTPRDLPRDQFERHAYPYSDTQLDEWRERAMAIARNLWRCHAEGEWMQQSTACAHWGKCEFYKLCWETDPDYRLAAALSADYQPRTPSPFEDESNGKERE